VSDIIHSGVKGMKWGVHKQQVHSDYSDRQRRSDAKNFGDGGVNRINARMHEGKTHSESVKSEKRRNLALGIGITAAAIAAEVLLHHGPVLMQNVAVRAETKRGQAAAAAAMGISNKAHKIRYAKFKSGAYKITTL